MLRGRTRREAALEQLSVVDRFTLAWPESRRLVRYSPALEAGRRHDRAVLASRVDGEVYDWLMSR